MHGDPASGRARRLVVGITAADGAAYALRLLELARAERVETHLVVSEDAHPGLEAEIAATGGSMSDLADHVHPPSNQAARISSGSFLVDGMIVVPCTTAAAGAIAHGVDMDLIHRAAGVTIKEGRRLGLLVVEDGLSPIARENLEKLAGISGVSVIRPVFPALAGRRGSGTEDDGLDETVELLMKSVGLERGT